MIQRSYRRVTNRLDCCIRRARKRVPVGRSKRDPDLRGTWKGESESIILGGGNPHHAAPSSNTPRLNSVAFTMTIDKQDGRRFSGTFSSPRGTEAIIAIVSRSGNIYMVDDDGYNVGTMLAPNRMELCYLSQAAASRIASCTELTKQP
jgi:hypothetical protein